MYPYDEQQMLMPPMPEASPMDFFGVGAQGQAMNQMGMTDPRAMAWAQALGNMANMNMGMAPGINPAMAGHQARMQNARLMEMRARGIEERRARSERARLLEMQSRRLEADLDPMHDFNKFVEARGMGDAPYEDQLAAFSAFQTASMKANAGPASLQEMQWLLDPSRTQAELDTFWRNKRADQIIDLGGGGVGARTPAGGLTTVVTPEQAMDREAALETATTMAGEQAKTQAEREATAPEDIQQANTLVRLIKKAIDHPGREAATGASSVFNRVAIPGTDRQDYLTLAAQLKGNSFMQAYQSLKGGGQITEIEGKKAEEAQNRLNEAQSEQEYLNALQEMLGMVEQRASRIPGYTKPKATRRFNPATGQLEDI